MSVRAPPRGPALHRSAGLACVLAALAPPAGAQQSQPGLDGAYTMTREGSGTSWQPDSTPMSGLHTMRGAWMTMVHGQADFIYDDQGGARGATQSFSTSMLMFMARRELSDAAFGFRVMASTD